MGCNAWCEANDDLENRTCAGSGCCQMDIPKNIRKVDLRLRSFSNYTDVSEFNDCGYAFVAEEGAFNFSADSMDYLKGVHELSMVIDWDIGNETDCDVVKMETSTYACRSVDSSCSTNDNGDGYRCFCNKGYHGNPYLDDGCKVMNVFAPKGIMAMGKEKAKVAVEEKLIGRQSSSNEARIFSASELQKATNNFHNSMIIGQGGHGTVYKGVLQDDDKVEAIKKSKRIDPNEIDQFINEVVVLSQINHRNVVKLLGCCLETEAPLLVYEFISNGTLFEHIHNKAAGLALSWDMRLRIAMETAGVLSYLHSAASTPIIHRDVKTANILLDHTYIAKVADFGASRLVPLDHSQLSTLVQGIFGYLDPEYLQSQQLTEKSDVYSFGEVLVELLTGRKAVIKDGPEEERCLANFFIKVMKEEKLFQVVEDNLMIKERDKEAQMKVGILAKRCMNVRGQDRPFMKEVAMELEGLRVGGKQSWIDAAEDEESLLSKGYSGFSRGGNNTSTVGFDSLKDHMILPVDGGR
ncbi:hypothetical protein ACS0TY_036139 [Phlomoides rotata]